MSTAGPALSDTAAPARTHLRRALSLPLLTLYGLGVTVGAGIYVLIGATAAVAGPQAWVSFLLAACIVAFTAFSYAELSTRYPVSAGEAAYVEAGLGRRWIATGVGLLVALSGIVSASAVAIGAAGYIAGLTGFGQAGLVVAVVLSMGLVAWWGISQSVTVAAIITVLEILGLVCVIIWGFGVAERGGVTPADLLPTADMAVWSGIAAASLLAFFAFIGFEDMVNVAEEVKDPTHAMPRAIFLTLIVATVLYVATCIAVLVSVPIAQLSGAAAPLMLVFANAPEEVRNGFAVVAIVATVNGVLIQMIMASRVLYGLADRGQLPALLAQVSPRTQTPSVATGCVTLMILGFGLLLPIEALAGWTSQIVLGVFVLVNLALIRVKARSREAGMHFRTPLFVPILGVVTSGLLLLSGFIAL
ncbi:MAG: APC family permease [Pseudomonadota bacterium]